uniref:Uncharacterized protein n=1 Tax=Hordeum vulgare subsp. vulgare TaxID=112509 RepID=A0A8I6YLS3_HORVV
MARHAMKGWGANLGADLRAHKGALLGQIKTLDDLADGTGLSRMAGPEDTPSMPSSWAFLGPRNYSGNVEVAKTGSSRGTQTPRTFRPSPTAVGGNVSSRSSGMGMLSWKTLKTSHPIFTPSIRSYSRLICGEAPLFVRTSGR